MAKNLRRALAAAGATPADVVSVRAFIVGMDEHSGEAVFPPVLAMFGGTAPAVTAVGVTTLAAPDLLVEIEAIAVV